MAMLRTFRTDVGAFPALDGWGALAGRVERRLHAALESGRHWRDLATSFYKEEEAEGLSAKRLEHVGRGLIGKREAACKAAADTPATLKIKAAAKERDVRRKRERLAKTKAAIRKLLDKRSAAEAKLRSERERLASTRKPSVRDKAEQAIAKATSAILALDSDLERLRGELKTLAFAVHQAGRRHGVLSDRLTVAESRSETPSICFGGRKLFNAQFHLQENGYRSHAEWLADWRAARSGNILVEGAARSPCGNEFVRASLADDGSVSLEIRLPDSLAHLADRSLRIKGADIHVVHVHGLRFHHGHDAVLTALRAHERDRNRPDGAPREGRPITWRFLKRDDGRGWAAAVSVHQETPAVVSDPKRGRLGVDVNEHHVAVTLTSADGNPLKTWRFPLCTHGKSTDQAIDLIRKVCAKIAALAAALRVPVVSEALDFAEKKARLETEAGPRRARMLSSFAYSSFDTALRSACLRSGVWHERVNPAFTSLIGRLKFARRYGLSVHAAAAHSIARRAMGLSERLPVPGEVLLGDGDQVTLLPLVKTGRRHVWSSWNRLARGLKAVLAAHARSNRSDRARMRLRRVPARSDDGCVAAQGMVGVHPDAGPGLDRRAAVVRSLP